MAQVQDRRVYLSLETNNEISFLLETYKYEISVLHTIGKPFIPHIHSLSEDDKMSTTIKVRKETARRLTQLLGKLIVCLLYTSPSPRD